MPWFDFVQRIRWKKIVFPLGPPKKDERKNEKMRGDIQPKKKCEHGTLFLVLCSPFPCSYTYLWSCYSNEILEGNGWKKRRICCCGGRIGLKNAGLAFRNESLKKFRGIVHGTSLQCFHHDGVLLKRISNIVTPQGRVFLGWFWMLGLGSNASIRW